MVYEINYSERWEWDHGKCYYPLTEIKFVKYYNISLCKFFVIIWLMLSVPICPKLITLSGFHSILSVKSGIFHIEKKKIELFGEQ
jgi:hypothetical protein